LKLIERLQQGFGPPLRKSELSLVTGYSRTTIDKLIEAGTIRGVVPEGASEERVPVEDAARLAREVGALPEKKT
jgi:hypothetical protein